MIFKSVKELNHHIKANCVAISFGSKGTTYYDKTSNKVIKIFDMALNYDDYKYITSIPQKELKKEDIIEKFSSIGEYAK